MENEKQIIHWLKAHDKRAISHLYDAYSGALYGLILRMVQSEEVAQDLVQDTFVKIWKNGHRYDASKGKLFTWVISIGRNTAINAVQSKAYKNSLKQQKIEHLVHANGNGSSNGHQSLMTHEIDVNKIGLKGLVNELDEKYRVIIELLYFKGYTQREAEEQLGIPLGTIKSRVRIALRELRKVFEHQTGIWVVLAYWTGI
ncbi:MAG: sigma-70 family RNA polymerase sigma factor [Bacteroidota bacterium]